MLCFQPLSKINAAVDSSTLMGFVTAVTGFENNVSTTQLGGFRGSHACLQIHMCGQSPGAHDPVFTNLHILLATIGSCINAQQIKTDQMMIILETTCEYPQMIIC